MVSSMKCACAILSSVACPDLQYISILSHVWSDFSKRKGTDHKMCVFIFTTNFDDIFLILRRIERVMIKNVYLYSCKVLAIMLDFHETWIFFDIFERKRVKYQNSWKSVQWEPSCSTRGQTDVQTDKTNVIAALCNFCERAKNNYWTHSDDRQKHACTPDWGVNRRQ